MFIMRLVVTVFILRIMKAIVGKKLGMTTMYDPEKGAVALTFVECAPCNVSLVRTEERDGYRAVQVSYSVSAKRQRACEFKVVEDGVKQGDLIGVDVFSVGDVVRIVGTTKGKGFQGVVKRHGFKGSPASHGHRHDTRAPGSIGCGFPQHVLKGKRMAGRMGSDRKTVTGMKVAVVDTEKNLLGLAGPIPGRSGSFVRIEAI